MEPTITTLIAAAEQGDDRVADALFAALYSELHRIAKRELGRHSFTLTLGATTLLHEAYLDMAARNDASFPDLARFMAYAARVMRGLIIDHARNRHAVKRGGQFEITSMDVEVKENVVDAREMTRLSDALDELAKVDSELTQIVDLKFFCGFSFSEIGAMRGVSKRTVQRLWDKARIYLYRSIGADLSV
jgi:RNA polymerase sigma factor (TIGR02999 family)